MYYNRIGPLGLWHYHWKWYRSCLKKQEKFVLQHSVINISLLFRKETHAVLLKFIPQDLFSYKKCPPRPCLHVCNIVLFTFNTANRDVAATTLYNIMLGYTTSVAPKTPGPMQRHSISTQILPSLYKCLLHRGVWEPQYIVGAYCVFLTTTVRWIITIPRLTCDKGR